MSNFPSKFKSPSDIPPQKRPIAKSTLFAKLEEFILPLVDVFL